MWRPGTAGRLNHARSLWRFKVRRRLRAIWSLPLPALVKQRIVARDAYLNYMRYIVRRQHALGNIWQSGVWELSRRGYLWYDYDPARGFATNIT